MSQHELHANLHDGDNNDEVVDTFVLVGNYRSDIANPRVSIDASDRLIRIPLPIIGLGDVEPPQTFTAEFVGLPTQLVQNDSVAPSVNLLNESGDPVEDYDGAHWD